MSKKSITLKSFFNPDFKNCYIETLTDKSNINRTKTVFYSARELETELGKDLYDFTKKEMIQLFEMNEWVNKTLFFINKTMIMHYIQFALNKLSRDESEVGKISTIKYSDINIVKVYKEIYYKSFEDLTETIDQIFKNQISDYTGLRMKCVCGLLWYGVPIEDVAEITAEDLDKKHGTIRCANLGRRVAVPSYILNWCFILSKTYMYTNTIGNNCCLPCDNKIIKIKETDYKDSVRTNKQILLGISSNFQKVVEACLKNMSDCERQEIKYKKIMYTRVMKNGEFERAYEVEKKNNVVFANSTEYSEAISCKKNKSVNYTKFEEYKTWKQAFGL